MVLVRYSHFTASVYGDSIPYSYDATKTREMRLEGGFGPGLHDPDAQRSKSEGIGMAVPAIRLTDQIFWRI
jgi:hypothetical protein